MPNSKHRKRQLATNRKNLERARRKLLIQSVRERENEKENLPCGEISTDSGTGICSSVDRDLNDSGGDPGWLGSLYSWCHSGISQVG
jgi:protein subunit release factor B